MQILQILNIFLSLSLSKSFDPSVNNKKEKKKIFHIKIKTFLMTVAKSSKLDL